MNYISSTRQHTPRTSERVPQAVLGLLFVFLFAWIISPPAGVPAQGTVVSCRHTGHGGKVTDFSFTVNEESYRGFEYGCRRENASAIDILYVASNPTIAESQIDQKGILSLSNLAAGFFGSFIFVVGVRYSILYSKLCSMLNAMGKNQ
jgi:hypothetical protein